MHHVTGSFFLFFKCFSGVFLRGFLCFQVFSSLRGAGVCHRLVFSRLSVDKCTYYVIS